MVQIHPAVSKIWVPQSLAKVLPDLTSFWPMGEPIWCKWANNYDVAQLQVLTSPWNFQWGKSIQRFQRYTIRKVWTQFVANLTSFTAHEQAHMGQMGKWPRQCTTTVLDNSTELRTENIKSQWSVLLAFSLGNPLVTGEFHSQWTINEDMRTKSW